VDLTRPWRGFGVLGLGLIAVLASPGLTARAAPGPQVKPLSAKDFLLDDAPEYVFPTGRRLAPLMVSELSAVDVKLGYKFNVDLVVPFAPVDFPLMTRVVFYPPRHAPWAMEWDLGATDAKVVQQTSAGAPGTNLTSLPGYQPTNDRVRLKTVSPNETTVTLLMPMTRLYGTLTMDTGIQLVHQFSGSNGIVGYQGSPIVALGALTGTGAQIPLPAFGITYLSDGAAQPWAVTPTQCHTCTVGNYEDLRHLKLSTFGPLRLADKLRVFSSPQQFESRPFGSGFPGYDGVACDVAPGTCQLFHGDAFEATITGQATVKAHQQGKRATFTFDRVPFLQQRGFVGGEVLWTMPSGAGDVAVWTPRLG
jgi:hypothetical protein